MLWVRPLWLSALISCTQCNLPGTYVGDGTELLAQQLCLAYVSTMSVVTLGHRIAIFCVHVLFVEESVLRALCIVLNYYI